MKTKVYVRFARYRYARSGFYVDASPTPKPGALVNPSGGELHTLCFAVSLDIPDELLEPAKWPVVELELAEGIVERPPLTLEPVGEAA